MLYMSCGNSYLYLFTKFVASVPVKKHPAKDGVFVSHERIENKASPGGVFCSSSRHKAGVCLVAALGINSTVVPLKAWKALPAG